MNGKLKKQIKNTLEELKSEVTQEGKEALGMLERSFGEIRREMSKLKSRFDGKCESVESLCKNLDGEKEQNRILAQKLRIASTQVGSMKREWERRNKRSSALANFTSELVRELLEDTFAEETERLIMSEEMKEELNNSDEEYLSWLVATYRSLKLFSETDSDSDNIQVLCFGNYATGRNLLDSGNFFVSFELDKSESIHDLEGHLQEMTRLREIEWFAERGNFSIAN
jgi:hypothetical protein